MAINPDLVSAAGFATPNTPDLGCFVRQQHPFGDIINFFFWNAFPPFEPPAGPYIPHQVYVRVKCGEAGSHQRVRAWRARASTDPFLLLHLPPEHVFGGDHRPKPSDWVKFPVEEGETYYWFAGEHRPPGGSWRADASVGHVFDIYENGTLSTVGWDDSGGDLDYNDLTMEVAIVHRRSYFDRLAVINVTDSEAKRFQRHELPKVRTSEKVPPRLRKRC